MAETFDMVTEEGQQKCARFVAQKIFEWGEDHGRSDGLYQSIRTALSNGVTYDAWKVAVSEQIKKAAPALRVVLADLHLPEEMLVRAMWEMSIRKAAN